MIYLLLSSLIYLVSISLCLVLHKYGCLLGVWKCNINPYGGLLQIKVMLWNMLLYNRKLRLLKMQKVFINC